MVRYTLSRWKDSAAISCTVDWFSATSVPTAAWVCRLACFLSCPFFLENSTYLSWWTGFVVKQKHYQCTCVKFQITLNTTIHILCNYSFSPLSTYVSISPLHTLKVHSVEVITYMYIHIHIRNMYLVITYVRYIWTANRSRATHVRSNNSKYDAGCFDPKVFVNCRVQGVLVLCSWQGPFLLTILLFIWNVPRASTRLYIYVCVLTHTYLYVIYVFSAKSSVIDNLLHVVCVSHFL